MNWKTWVPLVLAIVLGAVAAKVARDTILKNKIASGPAGKFVKLVVSKADIVPGKELTTDDLSLAQVQSDAAPASSFKTVEEIVGRVSEMAIVKGQPIVETMLTQQGSGSGLQALVPPGMRAITMEVNEFSGLAGLVAPGCRVDILATISESGTQIAKTIVQNVQVKAVGQRTTLNGGEPPNPNEMFRSVTILATLADAEAIELACTTGRPRLVLRGGRDNQILASAGITLRELRGGGGERDPFALSTGRSTTQPSGGTAQAFPVESIARRDPTSRVVKIFKGGVESHVTLSIANGTPENAIGNTDQNDPFRGN